MVRASNLESTDPSLILGQLLLKLFFSVFFFFLTELTKVFFLLFFSFHFKIKYAVSTDVRNVI